MPAFPGCYSQGATLDETLENVKEAVGLYLEMMQEEGREIPKDEDAIFQVSVSVWPSS